MPGYRWKTTLAGEAAFKMGLTNHAASDQLRSQVNTAENGQELLAGVSLDRGQNYGIRAARSGSSITYLK